MVGIESAVRCGARYVEVDIQITSDRVPILYHDANWQRVSAAPGQVYETTLADAQAWGAPAADRFGDQFQGTPLATVRELAEAAHDWFPQVRVFLEIKADSLKHFGTDNALAWIAEAAGFGEQAEWIAAVISFDAEAIARVRDVWNLPIGWVLTESSPAAQEKAARLAPEFLFCHEQRLPSMKDLAWQGRWQWAIYPVNECATAERLFSEGWEFVESDDVQRMLSHFQAVN